MTESTLPIAISLFENATRAKVFSIRQLVDGTANDIYLINLTCVLRVRRPNETDKPFYLPQSECAILKVLPSTIAPELLAFDSANGHMLHRYIQEGEQDQQKDATFRLYRNLIETVKLLHGFNQKSDFSFFYPIERFNHYKKIAGTSFDEAYEEKVIQKALQAFSRSKTVLCHNLLHRQNFLYEKFTDSVKLIDFEFAGMNYEIFDLASILSENEIEGRLKGRLINLYYGVNAVTDALLDDIEATMRFQDLLWYYWAEARYKETLGQNYLDIAKKKMARIRKAIRSPKDGK